MTNYCSSKPGRPEGVMDALVALQTEDNQIGKTLVAYLEQLEGQTYIPDNGATIAAIPCPSLSGKTQNGINQLAYQLWSVHPKDVPHTEPEGYPGGARAWYYANQIAKLVEVETAHLRLALQFYADPKNYDTAYFKDDMDGEFVACPACVPMSHVDSGCVDEGDVARRALTGQPTVAFELVTYLSDATGKPGHYWLSRENEPATAGWSASYAVYKKVEA